MKQRYVKVTIEAPAYEAKAAAEQYSKDRKYEVLSRSKPYPCKESSNVKIYLHVIKKTQLGYKHEGGWKKAGKHGKQAKIIASIQRGAHIIRADGFWDNMAGNLSPGYIYGVEIEDDTNHKCYDIQFELGKDWKWRYHNIEIVNTRW